MIKQTLRNPALRKRATQFGRLVRHSAVTPRCGQTHKPRLVTNGELGVTFIGHASFFVQIGGRSVMIDPNFARWLFVLKRLRRPGLRINDLPAIDLVLVSHAHFDHLHRPSLRAIVQNNLRTAGKAPAIVIPTHVSDLVSDLGFSEIIELDWWKTTHLGNLTVTHVPSRHWGARILKDSHRGYGGFVLKAGKHSVYHAGDTAYFAGFREIGRRLSPKSRYCRLAPTIRRHSATSIRILPTPLAPSLTSSRAGWSPCTTAPSDSRMSPSKNRCNCWTRKLAPMASRTGS